MRTYGSHPWLVKHVHQTEREEAAFQWHGERRNYFESYRWSRHQFRAGVFSQDQLRRFLAGRLESRVRLVPATYSVASLKKLSLQTVAGCLTTESDIAPLDLPEILVDELRSLVGQTDQ